MKYGKPSMNFEDRTMYDSRWMQQGRRSMNNKIHDIITELVRDKQTQNQMLGEETEQLLWINTPEGQRFYNQQKFGR